MEKPGVLNIHEPLRKSQAALHSSNELIPFAAHIYQWIYLTNGFDPLTFKINSRTSMSKQDPCVLVFPNLYKL